MATITSMRDDVFLFDSEKFKDLTLDWADVVEVYSPNRNRYVRGFDEEIAGTGHIVGDAVTIQTDSGPVQMTRSELTAILPGELRELSRWSGHLGLAFNGTWGASHQSTFSTNAWLMREDAHTRGRLDYTVAWGQANGVVNVNNMWANGKFDVFLSKVFFVTPLFGLVGYNDFLNLGLRGVVGAGAGVHLLDRPKIEWDFTVGGAYLYTRYSSVLAPASDVSHDAAVMLGTRLHWDIATDIDLDLGHTTLLVPTSFGVTQFDTWGTFSMDVWRRVELDLTVRHTRIREPQARSDGTVPNKDQVQLLVGLGLDL